MSAKILSGTELAKQMFADIKRRVAGRKIGLSVILVGDDAPSEIYVAHKMRACAEVGISATLHRVDDKQIPQNELQDYLVYMIEKLNTDDSVDGVLVQLPLPKHVDARAVLSRINPEKDVDGFHGANAGALFLGDDGLVACTAQGVMRLLESTGVDLRGKHAVVVGASNLVGKPTSVLLLAAGCTVTVCHSLTVDLEKHTRMADVLVVAVGKQNLVTADMVKPGAIVVDVGINRVDGKIYGDVDFDGVKKIAGYITPVPGGVGPMTVAQLLDNTVRAALQS